jgi:hypothetical protein
MKTRTAFILSLTAIITLAAGSAFGAYSGGIGEPNDPYIIATAEDLNDIGNHQEDWNKNFKLVADVNLAGYTGTQFNRIGTPESPFCGVFDGNGHVIYNLTYISTTTDFVGVFGYIWSPAAEIKNLGLEDVNVMGGGHIGAMIGWNRSGTVSNCYSTGMVSGTKQYIGGLIGENDSIVSNCYSTCEVNGCAYVGGLVGYNSMGSDISNCHSTGTVMGFATDMCYSLGVGGLVGVSGIGTTITNCYSMSTVTGFYDVGDLVGQNGGNISDCYSTGAVSSGPFTAGFEYMQIGGLVGNNFGIVSNCHSTATVSVSSTEGSHSYYIGGLIGLNSGTGSYIGNISHCYSTGTVSGFSTEGSYSSGVGGLIGSNHDGSINKCYSSSIVSGSWGIGGLAGYNTGGISNCYSTGSVTGNEAIGGLIGSDYHGAVSDCYSIGSVSGALFNFGGLIGSISDSNIAASFWDTETSGRTTSAGGEGKTTVEMKMLSTFTSAGWDFVDAWGIGNGQTYPYLKSFNGINPADLNYSGTVDFEDFAIFSSHWLESSN